MSDIKQYVLINKSNGWTHGKYSAQVAHATMKVFFDRMTLLEDHTCEYHWTDEMIEWHKGSFTKIILKVNDTSEQLVGATLAKHLNIPYAIVDDNGVTQKTIDNKTVAIGPFDINKPEYKSLVAWLQQWKLY
jgi:peptidyl-tRNA hydrolase